MKSFLAAAAVVVGFILIGCASDPIRTDKTDNAQVQVGLLFIHDGCKVYRFYDEGEPVYFAKCDNSLSTEAIVPRHLAGKVIVPQRAVSTN